jgi:DNA-directed RNA polymerase specialized sigma subunit, sigma24 homolog
MTKGVPTKEAFEKLLHWLDSDREKAGEKYEKIRFRLIKIFVCRGCYEVEDLADETINVVLSKIDWLAANYVGEPGLYFYAVAKKIHLEQLKKRPPPNPPPPDPKPPELEQVCSYLDDCLDHLPSGERDLVLRYHQGDKQEKIQNRKKLAEELKISRNALRIKVCHIHSRLRDCLEGRLQEQSTE